MQMISFKEVWENVVLIPCLSDIQRHLLSMASDVFVNIEVCADFTLGILLWPRLLYYHYHTQSIYLFPVLMVFLFFHICIFTRACYLVSVPSILLIFLYIFRIRVNWSHSLLATRICRSFLSMLFVIIILKVYLYKELQPIFIPEICTLVHKSREFFVYGV